MSFTSNANSLCGKRTIITGASRGLGLEIANKCLGLGADIAICARSASDLTAAEDALRQRFPNRLIVSQACDITSPENVDDFFRFAVTELGGLDVLINNVGTHGPILPFSEIEWSDWVKTIETNLVGSAYCCQKAIKCFIKDGHVAYRRRIVNLVSNNAIKPQRGLSAYSASKAGLIQLTEALAQEVYSNSIDINSVIPGPVLAGLLSQLGHSDPAVIGHSYHQQANNLILTGGEILERAANFCAYLASPLADTISGRVLSVSGDESILENGNFSVFAETDLFRLRRIECS
jgi:3-oxoacyl-[acyl-carrier protein] reductase